MSIYAEIRKERARQDEKWGGPQHDDYHTTLDWARFIRRHADRGRYRGDFRKQMIRVAALAVAAIESHDRHK